MKTTRPDTLQQNTQRPAKDFKLRLGVAFGLVALSFGALAARFVYLQVYQHQNYTAQATTNRITLIPTPPIRGEIVDANGVVLARNYPVFSLELTPKQVEGKVEDVIDRLRAYVDISEADLKRFQKFRTEYRSYEKVPLKLKLEGDEASRLAPHLYEFKGVEINARTFREYPYGPLTAHFLGYIGRISDRDQQRIKADDNESLYRGTTHIGKSGLESYYEAQLHGSPGYQQVEKNAHGDIVRVLNSTPQQSGQTLKLAMDIRLQQEADRIIGNRRAAMVAIDPQTGGVLAFVSKPSYDPNLFLDGIDADTWKQLNEDWQRPLINRVTQGLYPPGSTFKPFMGMALLESGKLTTKSIVPAPGAWSIPGSTHLFRDSVRSGHGAVNLSTAIQVSSDTFFYRMGYEAGIDKLGKYLAEFGFGQPTGIDLPHEYKGILPSPEWKAKRFAKLPAAQREWHAAEMVPVSIGQGYNAYTPLQMAHATASLANNGVVYRPHLVKEILDYDKQQVTLIEPKPSDQLPFKPEYFDYIKQAMQKVLRPGGTAAPIGGAPYTMGGKTGTAQVVQIKQGKSYNAASLKLQNRDHAWFIAFAPVDKPKIAVALILENGGWGATAAPLVRKLTDYYLLNLQGGSTAELNADNASSAQTTAAPPSVQTAKGFQTGLSSAAGASAP